MDRNSFKKKKNDESEKEKAKFSLFIGLGHNTHIYKAHICKFRVESYRIEVHKAVIEGSGRFNLCN
jgi:hypothetical protein